jgi:ankyrin repeat protein
MGDIFRAVEEGNEEEVIRLLDADPALLEREDDGGVRPLVLAAQHEQLGVARLLIERGVNVNATGDGGGTVLHHATADGTEEVVALLLDKGAHANTSDDEGITPLMCACANGHLGVAKMLVQHMKGRGLDERNEAGWTALHFAVYAGREDLVMFLLLDGADPTITDNEGRTPRALAEHRHNIQRCARSVAVFEVRSLIC